MFAEVVRAHRRRLGVTQEELADRTGLSVRSLRKIEGGRTAAPRTATVRLLADAFGLAGADRDRFCQAATGAAGDSVTNTVVPPPPRQLPAAPQMFTGRADELAEVGRLDDASTLVITAIDGMAGVGKTGLAVHAAHRLADRYPGGQLFIDLHGYTPGMAPVEPAEALERVLRALGVAGQQIPVHLDERAALYRSRLADQRMLILLDNAATESQVAPLLPGAPGCLVLITSRRRLTGLDRTHTVSLDTLPLPDAVTLFLRTTGEQRLAGTSPELIAETVQLCGRLPLAIRIAAARLRSRPAWGVVDLMERLRDHGQRLRELEAGHRSVTAALDLSYQQLPSDLRRGYRLLGLHPGPHIDVYAAAALTDTTVGQARRLLDHLLDANLLQEAAPGRCVFHDLVSAHAAQVATAPVDADSARHAALSRLFDHFRYTASMAALAASPFDRDRHPPAPDPTTPTPALRDPAQAAEWLDAELPNLLAAAHYAADHGWPGHTVHLSVALERHLRSRSRYREADALHRRALAVARAGADRSGEVDALVSLGFVHRMQGGHEAAAGHYVQALTIAQAAGDRTGEVDALIGLGWTHGPQGRHQLATDLFRRALEIASATGNRTGELNALNGLGPILWLQGRYDEAAEQCRSALHLARVTGNRTGEVAALIGLGDLHVLQEGYARAADHYSTALGISRTIGSRTGELTALRGLGHVHRKLGRCDLAAHHYRRVLDLAVAVGNRNMEFEALQGLGRVHHATGRLDEALTCHSQALELAAELRQPVDRARAHDGLAQTHQTLGRPDAARRHWQEALDILAANGVDHIEETSTRTIRARLAGLDPSPPPPRG
jgi:tetratricopeptide (TPR) repeat protein/transcriptional regulator with XRE-family HTH domain